MQLCQCDEELVRVLSRQLAEEELLLAVHLYRRHQLRFIALNHLIGGSHVEDEFAADKFGGGVIGVDAGEPDRVWLEPLNINNGRR